MQRHSRKVPDMRNATKELNQVQTNIIGMHAGSQNGKEWQYAKKK